MFPSESTRFHELVALVEHSARLNTAAVHSQWIFLWQLLNPVNPPGHQTSFGKV